ncbi:MAG: sugar ABC transporter ATP-binding protein [Firmicutes bacterium]|nr:sugar ABC transporter ATP-binding protein [Bacillota bacterium]
MSKAEPIVRMKNISKEFPGVKALSNVDFELSSGEIHALMGENGAGKSTLIKVLTGVHQAEKGKIYYKGKEIKPANPIEAQQIGISTVYQEVNLCPNLSVSENIFIGREPIKNGKIDWKTVNTKARELLKTFNIEEIDVTKSLSYFSVAIQQMVAIARALEISAKVLVLDEPTASLDQDETSNLFKIMEKLKQEGMAIIFITHFIDDVYKITDRVTVLRNGKIVDTSATESLPKLDLVAKMIGKDLEQLENIKEKSKVTAKPDELFIEGRQLVNSEISPFDLSLHKGEVLGLAGLLGSGRTELVELIFGLNPAEGGQLKINESKKRITSPKAAMENKFALCPEDRKTAGLIDDLTVRENLILSLQVERGCFNYLPREEQEKIADQYIELLNIATPSAEQKVKNLSGGNQQKVILARWLITQPDLLILDEPTRGIDVGTKTEIQKMVLSLADEGMSIIFISSELDEVIRVSQRVAVLRDRKKVTELSGDEINESNIMGIIAEGGA